MRKILGIGLCLVVGLSSIAKPTVDDGVVRDIFGAEALFVEQQHQFLPISPPMAAVYVHRFEVPIAIDFKKFPKEFTAQLYAEMEEIDGSLFPVYRILAYEDPSVFPREVVFQNSLGAEIYRLQIENYNPYEWQTLHFQLEEGEVLDDWTRWIFDPAHIAVEFVALIPKVFHEDYLLAQEAEAMQEFAMVPMAMSLPAVITNLVMGINSTNGLVELEIGWPMEFTNGVEIFTSENLISNDWQVVSPRLQTLGLSSTSWLDSDTNQTTRFYHCGDADTDTDEDSLTDAREILVHKTDKDNRDTDDDGASDGYEILIQGSDPLNPDSDGDGLLEGIDPYPLLAGPQILINSPLELETVTNNTLTVEGVAVFEGTVQSVLVDAQSASLIQTSNECAFSAVILLDREGVNTFYVQATGESSGKLLGSESKRTVIVDAQAPELSVLSCSEWDTFTNLYVHFTVQTDDPAFVLLNGGAMARDGFMNYGWAGLAPGTNSVVFDSTDSYGRATTHSITVICNVPVGYTEVPPSDMDQDGTVDSEDPAPNDPAVRSSATVTSAVNGSTVNIDDVSEDKIITVAGTAPAYSTVTIALGGIKKTVLANASGTYSVNMQLQAGLNTISVSGSGFQTTSYVTAYIPPPRLDFLLTWTSNPNLPISLNIAHSKNLPIVNGAVAPSNPNVTPTAVSSGDNYIKKLVVDASAGSYLLDMKCFSTPTYIGSMLYNYITGESDWSQFPEQNWAVLRVSENGTLAYTKAQPLKYWGEWQIGLQSPTHIEYRYFGGVEPWSIGHFAVHSGMEAGGYVVTATQPALAPQMGRMGQTLFEGIENLALFGPNGSGAVYLQPGQAAQFNLKGWMRPSSFDWQYEKINAAFDGPVDKNGVFLANKPGYYQVGIKDNLLQATNGTCYTINDVPPIDVYVMGVSSEAVATTPANRTRKTLGVGEEVELTFLPAELSSSVIWSVSGGGTLDNAISNKVVFIAPNSASLPTVTATYNGQGFDVSFAVIEPVGVSAPVILPVISGYGVNDAGAGMGINLFLEPDTVSFYNVKVMEVGMISTDATGYFSDTSVWPVGILDHGLHGANNPVEVQEDNHIGQAGYVTDVANSGICPQSWTNGHFSWPIPGVWWVDGSSNKNSLPWSDQHFYINPSGTVTIEKFGHTVTRETNNVYTVVQ